MNILELKNEIKTKRTYLSEEQGKLKILNLQLEKKNKEQKELKDNVNENLTIKSLIERSASEARENGIVLLEQILTSSLQTVFGEGTEAKLTTTLKDGIPSLNISVLKEIEDGVITIDPTEADGGGLADIVALSAFMGFGQLVQKNYAPYILDEPTKYVSEGNKAIHSAEFVKNMVNFTGKQTIVSTHDKSLMSQRDNGYKLVMDEHTGITSVYKDDKEES